MRLSKTEINLMRLVACAPKQKNQAKLIHYVSTLREQLEQLGAEASSGVTSISKAKLNEYSEKIEALAATIVAAPPKLDRDDEASHDPSPSGKEQQAPLVEPHSPGLRRRTATNVKIEERTYDTADKQQSPPVKLDDAGQAHIEKHRKLQEDLTDEMVVLARQLKESSLMMSQSVQTTEKILDSTEGAVEHSLASTGRVNTRTGEIYSQTVKTSCFTWLLLFIMCCIFVMVILLIRVT